MEQIIESLVLYELLDFMLAGKHLFVRNFLS